jgi:hypothetical protein
VRQPFAREFLKRNGQLGGPAIVGGVERGEVFRIPTRIPPTILGQTAAVIDLEAVVRLIVAIEIEKDIDPIMAGEVGVAEAPGQTAYCRETL